MNDQIDQEKTRSASMSVTSIAIGPKAQAAPYRRLTIGTNRGDVSCRYYPSENATVGVVLAGGMGGAWNSPGGGRLFPDISAELSDRGIASVRIEYRHPTNLVESILDVLAGTIFLTLTGVHSQGLVGHSLGAAAVAQAATFSNTVKTVVLLSTQSFGAAEAALTLGGRASMLLMHGTEDDVLPSTCSEFVYALAKEPKEIILLPGGDHMLMSVEEEARERTVAWLSRELV